jgi:hypothetical protein
MPARAMSGPSDQVSPFREPILRGDIEAQLGGMIDAAILTIVTCRPDRAAARPEVVLSPRPVSIEARQSQGAVIDRTTP